MTATFEVTILGINRTATCRRDGSGMMTVHAERVGGTDYMSYDRQCDCGHPNCYEPESETESYWADHNAAQYGDDGSDVTENDGGYYDEE